MNRQRNASQLHARGERVYQRARRKLERRLSYPAVHKLRDALEAVNRLHGKTLKALAE